MSDFENGVRVPDYDEREEAALGKLVCCPQCNQVCGRWYPASPQTWECPGEPAFRDCYEGSAESDSGVLFCSADCLRIYTED